jgi:uncharacterized protein YjbI with pentapeptide repeats
MNTFAPSRSMLRQLLNPLLWLMFAGAALQSFAQAPSQTREPRIALIIANSNYAADKDKLGGPASDAGELNKALRKQGFGGINGAGSPTVINDRNQAQIRESVLAFRDSVRRAGPLAMGFLYYAGHGAADANGTDNFMLPVDVADVAAADPARVGVALTWVTDLFRIGVSKERPTVIVVFDACRNISGGDNGTRAAMPQVAQPDGVLVALSTGAGQSASDDGMYAEVLAGKLGVAGLTVGEMFDQIKIDVAAKSSNAQIPVHQSNVVKRQCVAGCNAVSGTDPLATLEAAVRSRPLGDLGQVAAVQALAAQGKSLAGLDLIGIGFAGAQIDGLDMRRAKLDGTDFNLASMTKTKLDESKFNFASLQGARLSEAQAEGTQFQFSHADGSDLRGIRASRASFHAASLKNADFRGADLRGTSFMLADLRGADFRNADLTGAFFIGSLIEGALFDGARVGNLDMTSAIGTASQFNMEQQAQLCATETDGRFRFELQRAIKTNAYASGIDVREAYSKAVQLLPSLHLLSRCAARTLLPAAQTIWPRRNTVESVASSLNLRYADEFLQAGNRRELFVQRAEAALGAYDAASKSGLRVQVVGTQHHELLAAMKRNQTKAGLESSPSSVIGLDYYFYMMKHGQRLLEEDGWDAWARARVEREKSMVAYPPSKGENVWPLLYPPGTTPAMLAPEHVEVFRKWTLQRIRNLPEVAELQMGARGLRVEIQSLGNYPSQGGPVLTARPLEALFAELHKESDIKESVRERIGQAVYAVSSPGLPGGVARRSLVRFKPTALKTEVRFPQTAVEALFYAQPWLEVVVKVTGASSVRIDEWVYDIVDVELLELRLHGRDVVVSSQG